MPETAQARAHRTIVSRSLQYDLNYGAIAAVHKRLDAGEGGSPNCRAVTLSGRSNEPCEDGA